MPTRLATAADVTAIKNLIEAVRSELVADFGVVASYPLARISALIADGQAKVIVYTTTGSTIRGAGLFVQTNEQLTQEAPFTWWRFELLVTQKTLTDAQRLAGFRQTLQDVCARIPNPDTTYLGGDMKVGGKLDTHLLPRIAGRTIRSDGLVRYIATIAEIAAGI